MKKQIAFLLLIACFLTGCQEIKQIFGIPDGGKEPPEQTISTPENTEEASQQTIPEETTEPTVPEETVTEPTQPAQLDWPKDAPHLPVYWDAIWDYKNIIDFRLSSQYDTDKPLPSLSETMEKALRQNADMADMLNTLVFELCYTGNEKQSDFGYILYDLNNDKTPELFWVRKDRSIVAAFTYYDKKLQILDSYWSRYCGYVGANGQFYTWGSNGAADNFCNVYILNKGKLEEVFSFGSESSAYGNNIGYYKTAEKTKIQITEKHFYQLSDYFAETGNSLWNSCEVYGFGHIPQTSDGKTTTTDNVKYLPYKQKIRMGASLYAGPGTEFTWRKTTDEEGVFTIVAEIPDAYGEMWGKLKSGSGWVSLTQVQQIMISINYADEKLLSSGNYHHYTTGNDEYVQQIAFRAYETLKNVSLFEIVITEEEDQEIQIFSLEELNSGKPLIADLAFPGDMSMYGIRFTDKLGNKHTYGISISGMDGSLEIIPYKN